MAFSALARSPPGDIQVHRDRGHPFKIRLVEAIVTAQNAF
jgi:hypothetical protein